MQQPSQKLPSLDDAPSLDESIEAEGPPQLSPPPPFVGSRVDWAHPTRLHTLVLCLNQGHGKWDPEPLRREEKEAGRGKQCVYARKRREGVVVAMTLMCSVWGQVTAV